MFRVGKTVYGIPLSEIREVALTGPLADPERLESAPGGHEPPRPESWSDADMGRLLGREPSGLGDATERLLVLDEGHRDLGLLVSEVLLIANLGGVGEEDAPPLEATETFSGAALAARVATLISESPLRQL